MSSHRERWLVAEAAQHARQPADPGPGVAWPQTVTALSGLQWMQAILRGEQPSAATAVTLLDSTLGCGVHAALSQGKLHAHGSTTCLSFDMRLSGPKAS